MRIGPNAHVTLDYVLRDEDGEVLDDSRASGMPMVYVHGYGMIVPGLEAGLAGLSAGDARDILVPAEAGFGERDEELVIEIDRADLPSPDLEPGDEVTAEGPDGDEVTLVLVELTDDGAVLDGNHPLAGCALTYAVEVREVRAATEEEVLAAAAEFGEAGYDAPLPGEPPPPALVQLGRKPS
ncbi:MAG: peptidylprolyl isomerase [Polyangiaceae bacterium]